MSRIDGKDYAKAREEVDIISLLEHYGYYSKDKKYSCPFHQEKTPSASIRNNRLKCFGCGKVATTIDLVMELEGVDQFTAVRKLLNKDIIRASKTINTIPLQELEGEEDTQKKYEYDYEYGLNISKASNKTNIGYLKGYLNKRGILSIYDKLKPLGVELRHNYYKNKNYICYNFINYNFIIQKAIGGSSKKNFGSPMPTYFKINNTNHHWYITEGIEDAFTLMLYHKFNVVCLNSVSNTDKFLEALKKNFKLEKEKSKEASTIKFIIAVDYDKSGLDTLEKLDRFFKTNDIEYDLYYDFYEYATTNKLKDVNECLIHSLNAKHSKTKQGVVK